MGMTNRRIALLFWVVAASCWPLPMLGLEGSYVPVARYVQLATAITTLGVLEGTEGMVGLFIGLLWAHALVWGLVLAIAAWVVARFVVARAPQGGRSGLVAGVVALVIVWGVLLSEYDTQFHHSDAHAPFWSVYR